jgi:hypothetical protein
MGDRCHVNGLTTLGTQDLKSVGSWFESRRAHQSLKVPRLRSGFRHAAQTPRKRLKFESRRAHQLPALLQFTAIVFTTFAIFPLESIACTTNLSLDAAGRVTLVLNV